MILSSEYILIASSKPVEASRIENFSRPRYSTCGFHNRYSPSKPFYVIDVDGDTFDI
jgi:hypothetical protein